MPNPLPQYVGHDKQQVQVKHHNGKIQVWNVSTLKEMVEHVDHPGRRWARDVMQFVDPTFWAKHAEVKS